MALHDVQKFLESEKEKLFKAKDYINSYYHQIITSLESLRDNLFPFSFPQRLTWKDDIDRRAVQISVPSATIREYAGDPEFNANIHIALINNLYAVQNAYLFNPGVMEKTDIKLVYKAHQFLLSFLGEQFSPGNINSLNKQQRDLAFTLRHNIEERIKNSITPFFNRLEIILDDEYFTMMFEHIKLIVGTFVNYKKDAELYDGVIARKCRELGLKNNPELNLVIIADLEKPESSIEREIRAKYEVAESKKSTGKAGRYREIAVRYCSQADNLQTLIVFLRETERNLLRLSFFRRVALFLRSLFGVHRREISHHDIVFSYLTERGAISRRRASLNELIHSLEYYHEYVTKFKEEIDLSSYTRSWSVHMAAEIEKFIDTSFEYLHQIYEKSNGFREWLGRENNRHLLQRIPEKQQEEFNNLLLHINRTCIINNYSLHELEV